MADWLDEFESTVRERKREQKTAEQLQLHKAEILKQKARGVLDKITDLAAAQVTRYSERFADLPERKVSFNAKPSGGFKLDKATYPAASVEVSPKGNDQIEATYGYTANQQSRPAIQTILLILSVNAKDEIEVKTAGRDLNTLDDAALFLIEKVLKA